MAKLEQKRPPLPANWESLRAALCARVDFLAVLQADGVAVKKLGDHYACALRRDDKNPSCHVWPPGKGTQGGRGWTFKDFGSDKAGDALGYLVDVRGLPFDAAVAELCRLTGERVEGWQNEGPGCPRNDRKPPSHTVTPPEPPRRQEPPTMRPQAQLDAALAFLSALLDIVPDADAQGAAYLAGRGCLPTGWPPVAYKLPAAAMPALFARLAASPQLPVLLQAGLLKPAEGNKPLRLQWGAWAGDVVLIVHHDRAGGPLTFIARRLDYKSGDRFGKYLQQTYAHGAARLPFGLLALYRPAGFDWKPAPKKAGDVLLVEGTLDALGAAVLGWPALGLSMRPQAGGYRDESGAVARMLEAHLPALRDMRRVRVVPDADPGAKGAEGEALAARLVGWLRFAGVKAEVSTMADLCPDAPEGCKDLADVAAKLKGCPP